MSASVPVPFPSCRGLFPAVTANVYNPSLIDPTEKVSSLMPDLSLRAIRAMGATEQNFGLEYLIKAVCEDKCGTERK